MRVFDSNILIYHLDDALPPLVLNQVECWITEGAVISVMSRIEVLGYPQTTDQLQQAMRLLAYFDEIPLHEPVVQWTITLRQEVPHTTARRVDRGHSSRSWFPAGHPDYARFSYH
jgi:hypothetical protein